MEMLGNAENAQALREKTPAVMAKYRSYKPILKCYAEKQEQDKRQVDKEEVIAILQKLRRAMDGFDLETVDEAMLQLEECRLPDSCHDNMELLRAYVADVAMEEVLNITDELIQRLNEV